MIRSLFTAASGMVAQQTNLDVVANNIANVNTTGFKKSRADFQDLMYQMVEDPGNSTSQVGTSPTGIQVGLGVKTAAVGRVNSQGDFQTTDNPLDWAIEGDGFFQVALPNGDPAYTRAGAFKLNENGEIVTSDGNKIDGLAAIPPEAIGITVASDGEVTYQTAGTAAANSVGRIQLVRFQNPAGLRAMGKNMMLETEASGTPNTGNPGEDGFGTIGQGMLESSNVSVVEEIIQMVTGQRAYEANSKVIQTADQLLSAALNVKR